MLELRANGEKVEEADQGVPWMDDSALSSLVNSIFKTALLVEAGGQRGGGRGGRDGSYL